MATSSSPSARRTRANESFGCAAQCIGKVEAGMSLFAVTRGQWSMIDAVLHVLDQVGPAKLSLWTWTVAEYEVQVLTRLREDRRELADELARATLSQRVDFDPQVDAEFGVILARDDEP